MIGSAKVTAKHNLQLLTCDDGAKLHSVHATLAKLGGEVPLLGTVKYHLSAVYGYRYLVSRETGSAHETVGRTDEA